MRKYRQLGDVVEHDHGEEDEDQDEGGLIDSLLDERVDIVAEDALDKQDVYKRQILRRLACAGRRCVECRAQGQ